VPLNADANMNTIEACAALEKLIAYDV